MGMIPTIPEGVRYDKLRLLVRKEVRARIRLSRVAHRADASD